MKVGDVLWTSLISTRAFTNIRRKGEARLKQKMDSNGRKFEKVNFTSSNTSNAPPVFPTVYVRKLQGKPIGYTLEDRKINGIMSVIQIEAITNTNQRDAEIIADVIGDILIEMGYEMLGDSFPDNLSDVYRNVSRWQRLIGASDILNF